jgi:hypothetical protein
MIWNSFQSRGSPNLNALRPAMRRGSLASPIVWAMFDESAEDLADLAAEYHEHHSPANPNDRFLVDTLIANEWRLRRLRRVEADLWEHATNTFMAKIPKPRPALPATPSPPPRPPSSACNASSIPASAPITAPAKNSKPKERGAMLCPPGNRSRARSRSSPASRTLPLRNPDRLPQIATQSRRKPHEDPMLSRQTNPPPTQFRRCRAWTHKPPPPRPVILEISAPSVALPNEKAARS